MTYLVRTLPEIERGHRRQRTALRHDALDRHSRWCFPADKRFQKKLLIVLLAHGYAGSFKSYRGLRIARPAIEREVNNFGTAY